MTNIYEGSDLLDQLCEKAAARGGLVTLGTHSGEFHADDVLATALLQHAVESRKLTCRITRSRSRSILEQCDIVYDVGGGIYDHHGTDKVYYPNGIPMAACGKLLKDLVCNEDIAEGLRRRLFYAVEANDNGHELPRFIESSRLYFIHMFNPTWMESGTPQESNKAFYSVLGMTRKIYERMIDTVNADIESRYFIEREAKLVRDGKIMLLHKYCPAQEYARVHPELLAVVYPKESNYVVRCMPTFSRKYETKITFPKEWHGLSNEELVAASGIEGAVFCPDGGYMSVFQTPQAARQACDVLIERKERIDAYFIDCPLES